MPGRERLAADWFLESEEKLLPLVKAKEIAHIRLLQDDSAKLHICTKPPNGDSYPNLHTDWFTKSCPPFNVWPQFIAQNGEGVS